MPIFLFLTSLKLTLNHIIIIKKTNFLINLLAFIMLIVDQKICLKLIFSTTFVKFIFPDDYLHDKRLLC